MAHTKEVVKHLLWFGFQMDSCQWWDENSRVLIITDRDELDEQIEKTYKGVDEKIAKEPKVVMIYYIEVEFL